MQGTRRRIFGRSFDFRSNSDLQNKIKKQRTEQLQVWKKQLLEKEILASLNYLELLEKKTEETKSQSFSEFFDYLLKL